MKEKKARLVPIYFKETKTDKFEKQLAHLHHVLGKDAEFLQPVGLGDAVPACEAVVFPEILGEAYRNAKAFREIQVPILLITSEFATVSMWDWEISNFLLGKGVETILPYSLEQALLVCSMLSVKRSMNGAKFLIFQDNPGEGFQPDIFKSFYWWEDECTKGIKDTFGITIERRSLKRLGEKAQSIADADAKAVWESWGYPTSDAFALSKGIEAAKLYLALEAEIDSDSIIGMGTNCLNESAFCKTTPCIAWNVLLEERGMLWACEGDTVSLATKYLVYKALKKPLLMTNIYPFLMGKAATKHEKIPGFPEFLPNPEDHILLAHCGYFGLLPKSMSCSWKVVDPVLAIVDEKAHVFDARMQTGPVTITKLDASLSKLMAVKGTLKGYVQYDSSSDCRNGGVLEVANGKDFMDKVYSHHIILVEGDVSQELKLLGKIMSLTVEEF